jgi:hypothetical protein
MYNHFVQKGKTLSSIGYLSWMVVQPQQKTGTEKAIHETS